MTEVKTIGKHKPSGPLSRVRYKGTKPALKGKEGLASIAKNGFILVQMDDVSTGYGHGWHMFSAKHFDVINRSKK